jgi:hypothetical protein
MSTPPQWYLAKCARGHVMGPPALKVGSRRGVVRVDLAPLYCLSRPWLVFLRMRGLMRAQSYS